MQTPEEFLEANGLETRTIDRAGLVAAFQKEMEAGLAGEPSSLKMIPTFTSPYGEVTKDTPVTVLDAGGTNFRAGTVTIPSDGACLSSLASPLLNPAVSSAISLPRI